VHENVFKTKVINFICLHFLNDWRRATCDERGKVCSPCVYTTHLPTSLIWPTLGCPLPAWCNLPVGPRQKSRLLFFQLLAIQWKAFRPPILNIITGLRLHAVTEMWTAGSQLAGHILCACAAYDRPRYFNYFPFRKASNCKELRIPSSGIYKPSLYFTGDTLRFCYRVEPVNTM
jgi:hypothetical protein